MNSHNINYDNNTEIVSYLGLILNEFDDFNKTLCGDKYISTQIPYIINELITKINDKKIFEIIFKSFEILKVYITCIDVEKFVAISYKWNIHKINFNLSEFLENQLSTKINDEELIHKIIYDYLSTLILNIEFALNNFKLILKNISNNYISKSSKFINNASKIENSKYKLSFVKPKDIAELYNNKIKINELDKTFKMIISDLFYVLRKLVSTSTYHSKLINENYESTIINFVVEYLPYQYYFDIIDIFECIELYIKCINLNKLITETEKMNIISINLNVREKILKLISNDNEARKKSFVKSLLHKLENIFICIDYITTNPRVVLNNAKAFIELDKNDDIFNF
jgi:hypothetical protein